MTTTVIGVGLIGGSMAIEIRNAGMSDRILGVENNPHHAEQAMALGLVDEILGLEEAVQQSDMVVVATPVSTAVSLLPRILDVIPATGAVTDVGSTKLVICDAIRSHPHRDRFVASHPIAGTENSGPSAAFRGLFQHKLGILCEPGLSAPDATARIQALYDILGMRLLFMEADEHDRHVAYVSHISHITSFVLATTVLEIEKSTATIFDLASSGFESTVRLAKSSPAMWTPIFVQNSRFVCEALDAYIKNITAFRDMVASGQREGLTQTMEGANEIRRVLAGINGKQPRT
jgi:prephenate dehydrogenase